VHINQFGFRPGLVGDEFAETLIAKAAEGVPVRLVVDRNGSDPEGSTRAFYARLIAAGIHVCSTRATRVRAHVAPLGTDAPLRWTLNALGHIDHRKVVVVDGRIGWVGGAGIEDHFNDGCFHDLFLRVSGPVVAQLQLVFLASFRWLGGAIPASEASRRSTAARFPRRCCTTRPAGTGRSPMPSGAYSRARPRRSTSSTRTSPTAE
jgi:cardiolipin synthase